MKPLSHYFAEERLRALQAATIELGLDRDALFRNIDPAYVERIPSCQDRRAQLRYDLGHMNLSRPLPSGAVPLELWLSAAISEAAGGPRSQVFWETLAALRAKLRPPPAGPEAPEKPPEAPPPQDAPASPAIAGTDSPSPEAAKSKTESILDARHYPWHHPNARELSSLLVQTFDRADDVANLAKLAGVKLGRVSPSPIQSFWTSLLENAAKQKRLRRLIDVVLDDADSRSIRPRIQLLILPVDLGEGANEEE